MMANMQIVTTIPDEDRCPTRPSEEETCRDVEQKFRPYIGQEFLEIEEAVTFYKIYALACGFDVRKYTTKKWRDGQIKSKLLVCNREGFTHNADNMKDCIRNHKVRCVGCKARIRLFMLNGEIHIDRFHAGHNHELISVYDREFQKLTCNLTDYHKRIILYNSRLKIGATRTYKMLKEHVNGFENIGASLNAFKNFQRDVKCVIHERDGQLFIDHFKDMAANRPGFYFDYAVDSDGSLTRAIWADATCRRNYKVFGDGVSFDPTYSTNKYNMAFTPFTGIDHHKWSVTFCGALVAKENAESFEWVFRHFLDAMGGKEPEYIITDQDAGILKAVPKVFKTARHRFCMWHIMNKVASKYGMKRDDYTDFMKKLNTIIWDEDIEAAEFDTKWAEIREAHGLQNTDWFKDMYSVRKQWVMAHCRDLNMGAVMRTTQRSESENSFFKRFEGKSGTLVEFWMRFESAMDQQRHTQKKLENDNNHTLPKTSTHLAIEAHGATVYTHNVFEEFQEEVKYSIDTCRTRGFRETFSVEVTTVRDANRERDYEVNYYPGTSKASCTCKLLERKGLLCRHIIWIYSSNGLKTIPVDNISIRWSKDALRSKLFDCTGQPAGDVDIIDGQKFAMSLMWSELHQTVGLLMGKCKEDVEKFTVVIKQFKEQITPVGGLTVGREAQMEQLLGISHIEEVAILPPKQSKNKGSGKRLLSSKEKAVKLSKKPKRLCANCKQLANHDKRNCPNPFVAHPSSPTSPAEPEEDGVREEDENEDNSEEEEDEEEVDDEGYMSE